MLRGRPLRWEGPRLLATTACAQYGRARIPGSAVLGSGSTSARPRDSMISTCRVDRCAKGRNVIVNVRPSTMIRWHRLGWRIFWRLKCRAGRPPIPTEIRELIRRLAVENPLWGQERIANELLLKLGIRVSPRTVAKYMPKRPPGSPGGDQRWSTFMRNQAKAILACDFSVAVTAAFRMLYVFVVIESTERADWLMLM